MDEDYLKSVGKIWTKKDLPANLVETEIIRQAVDSIYAYIANPSPKSVLISGDKGVGKSTLINLVSKKLKANGWTLFMATAGNVMAGQRYIGDLEQSVQNLLSELTKGKKNLWIVPRFQELYYGGRHEFSPVSILDQILPYVERGQLKIIGELDTNSLEKVIQNRPQLRSVFEILRIDPLSKENTLTLARDWIKNDSDNELWNGFSAADLDEAFSLSNQYLSYKENPGRFMDLLQQTKKLVQSHNTREKVIEFNNLIESLSNITGLPRRILDDREKLDLDNLKQHFSKKVIGQDEAIRTVIERIAMIKAGLTDPSRPAGVFLFVGPTGTGKTEVAKTLAEYLFGNEDRLIRLDMSEFQTQESTYKILGDASDTAENNSLVNAIRRKPFSVILLDEFEKAHPKIWDLFLQVFDDGRLSDQRGSLADFKHAIIILTSNIGASLPITHRVGFNSLNEEPMDSNMMKSINSTFRPEFVNRIDKIIMFNPLTKSVAKQILKNELGNVLGRRGLRRRGWDLDFEDSALEFLLEKGFSSTLGARPLKRAVERYLLAPLAVTIVNHDYPKGNQFLLVSSTREKLKVEFIDPDEPDYTWDQKKQILKNQKAKAETLKLEDVLTDPKGALSEFKLIESKLRDLKMATINQKLSERKDDDLEEMGSAEFWTKPERYEVLSRIEFLDRFESAFDWATSLYDRLKGPEKERLSYDPKLLQKLAQRIFLLDRAISSYVNGEAQDALLKIEYKGSEGEYGKRIENMYTSWARQRGMGVEKIKESLDTDPCQNIYSFSGFGAYAILKQEAGYHVFEYKSSKENEIIKTRVKVTVAPMGTDDYRIKDINAIMDRLSQSRVSYIIRRYKLDKSPLVKDVKNKWQTGKIGHVLAGNFDLF